MELYSAFEWLLIDLANQYGLDKQDYSVRLAWANENLDYLEQLDDADDPATFIAATHAVRDAQAGIPSGYMVELDSSSSGIQLLSVLTRCVTGMENTGVLCNGHRPDIYTKLTEVMQTEHERKPVKQALMCYMYGSKSEPEKAFGDQVPLFLEKAEEVAPRACIARSVLLNTWQPFADAHTWIMPDGFTVFKEVKQTKDTSISVPMLDNRNFTFRHKIIKGKEKAVTNAADVTHSIDALVVREMARRCNYDINRLTYIKDLIEFFCELPEITDRTKFVSLVEVGNIEPENIHEYDPQLLARVHELIEVSLEHTSFELVTIHDAFKCLPNYVQYMRETYNRILWDMYNSDLLMDIVHQITGTKYDNFPHEEDVAIQILQNNYAIN